MRRRARFLFAIASIIMTVLLAVAANLATGTIHLSQPWTWLVWLVSVILAASLVLLEFWGRPWQRRVPSDTDQLADGLAFAVRHALGRMSRRDHISVPTLIDVRWQLVEAADYADVALAGPPGPGAPRPTGQLEAIREFFRRLPSQRMVLLGPPGSGKTEMALHLAVGMLDSRTKDDRVPVLASLGAWDPHLQDFGSWLVEYLTTAFVLPRWVATRLVAGGWVLPILDGFDQVPAQARPLVLARLNNQSGPFVITSRGDEFASAVAARDVLHSAAIVELQPVSLTDAMEYLVASAPQPSKWSSVISALHADAPQMQALRDYLANPLYLSLARGMYAGRDRDPAELLAIASGEIAPHLLGGAIFQAYPRGSAESISTVSARHWLAYLASHMHGLARRDFSWWELDVAVPRWLLALLAAVVVAVPSTVFTSIMLDAASGFLIGGASGIGAILVGRYLLAVDLKPVISTQDGYIWWLRTLITAGAPIILAVATYRLGGLGLALIVGLVLAATFLMLAQLQATAVDLTNATPELQLKRQRIVALLEWWALAVVVAVIAGLVAWGAGAQKSVSIAGTQALCASLVWLTLGTTWGRYRLAHAWLAIRRDLPWRLFMFLRTELDLGLLRRVGPVYQFAYSGLQDALVRHSDVLTAQSKGQIRYD
jgi:hypothetical protein